MDQILDKLKNDSKEIYALGISLGANLLINYMSQYENPFKAAVSISCPFDLVAACNLMKGTMYEWWVLSGATKDYLEPISTHKIADTIKSKFGISFEEVFKTDSWDEVVRTFVAKTCLSKEPNGSKSVTEYYNKASCLFRIKDIDIPTLVLLSKDDPIINYGIVPIDTCKANENVIVAVTKNGSHC